MASRFAWASRRRRRSGLAELRGLQAARHRPIENARLRLPQHCRQGVRGGKFEQDLSDMAAQPTAETAKRYPGVVVGIKTAHFSGPEWAPVERGVEAGTLANVPVMVDYGTKAARMTARQTRHTKAASCDIYTHVYSGLRGEQDESGRVNPALFDARTRSVLFDVGHGGGCLQAILNRSTISTTCRARSTARGCSVPSTSRQPREGPQMRPSRPECHPPCSRSPAFPPGRRRRTRPTGRT